MNLLMETRNLWKSGRNMRRCSREFGVCRSRNDCPRLFLLTKLVIFCRLNYRMVFAVASEDAVYLYDTQQPHPFAYVTNIHYHTLSDLTWYLLILFNHITVQSSTFVGFSLVFILSVGHLMAAHWL